jgi:hypothetical protein
LVRREFSKKIESWLENAKSEEEREIVEMLLDNPKSLLGALSAYAILANYPSEAGKRAIGKLFDTFKNLNLTPVKIQIDNATTQAALSNIEIFINSRFNNSLSSSDALSIIKWSSGLIFEEFMAIAGILKKFPDAINKEVIDALAQKFSVDSQRTAPEIRKLSIMIKPPTPSDLNSQWNAEEMLKWATEQYLPYHFWLEETNQYDPRSSALCEAYGDWLFSNFVDLRSNYQYIAYKILPKFINPEKSEKSLLILVIDNFNFKFAETLRLLFQNAGFRLAQKQPYLSMLPSDTETSKRCLFAGQPKVTDVNQLSDYASLISEEWQKNFPQRRFRYLPSTFDLEEAKASAGDVILVNCNQIDEALHEDERKLGKKHAQQIEAELLSVATIVIQFCIRNNLAQNISLLICSDHGSTMIPNESHNEIDPAFFMGKTIDTHHRFVAISKTEYDKLPQNVKEYQTYLLESDLFGLTQDVLVARGYYRFKKTTEHFYVHGGLSPEETILPLMIFESGKAEIKMPIIRLLKDEFRYSARSIATFEIINENSSPIEEVALTITQVPGVIDILEPGQKIEKIDSLNKSETNIALRLSRKLESTKEIDVTVEFKMLGQSYTTHQRLPIQLKSLMETSFKL